MEKKIKPRVAIFDVYNKESRLFETEILHPIQTGCDNTATDLHILKDNTGDNISFKNTHYAELSAMYWVWKNYLKSHPELEYIGFCHYRRFLDFNIQARYTTAFVHLISYDDFSKIYKNTYNEKTFFEKFSDYDIVLPEQYYFPQDVYEQYLISHHPKVEFDKMAELVRKLYPEYVPDMEEYLKGNNGYYCLNYIMKKKLFRSFMKWIFKLLGEMDKISDWEQYKDYNDIKTPAYLTERFFNVWLRYQVRTDNIKIAEQEGLLLV